jgi:hypothetical protein
MLVRCRRLHETYSILQDKQAYLLQYIYMTQHLDHERTKLPLSAVFRLVDDNHGHFGGSSRSAGQGLHLNELDRLFHMPNFGCIFLSRGIPVPPTTGTFADSAA